MEYNYKEIQKILEGVLTAERVHPDFLIYTIYTTEDSKVAGYKFRFKLDTINITPNFKVIYFCWNENLKKIRILDENFATNLEIGSIWQKLSKAQQKYLAFHLDLF